MKRWHHLVRNGVIRHRILMRMRAFLGDSPHPMNQGCLMIGALVGGFSAFVFLARPWFYLPGSLAGAVMMNRAWIHRGKRQWMLMESNFFRRFLESFSAQVESGATMQQAIKTAAGESETVALKTDQRFSKELHLPDALRRLILDEKNGLSFRDGLMLMIQHRSLEMERSYFESLVIGSEQGADLGNLSHAYLRLLTEEESVRMEREAKLDATKREQYFLLVMPILLLASMHLTGMVSADYHLLDYAVRLVSGLLFGLAWLWSQTILEETHLSA